MATKTWYFTGTAKWAKIAEPDKEFQKYSIDVYLDDANLAKFQESGAQLKLRGHESDGTYVTFSRPMARIGRDGEVKQFGPPELLNADGEPYPKGTLIGNGSKVTVKVDVFDTPKGKGTRLEAIRVDDLVEYSKKEVDDSIEEPF